MGRRYLERRLYNEKKSKPFKRQRDPKWNNNPVYDVAHEKAYKDFDGEAQYFETLQKLDRRRRNLQVPLRTPTPTLDITTGNLVDAITTFGEVDLEPGFCVRHASPPKYTPCWFPVSAPLAMNTNTGHSAGNTPGNDNVKDDNNNYLQESLDRSWGDKRGEPTSPSSKRDSGISMMSQNSGESSKAPAQVHESNASTLQPPNGQGRANAPGLSIEQYTRFLLQNCTVNANVQPPNVAAPVYSLDYINERIANIEACQKNLGSTMDSPTRRAFDFELDQMRQDVSCYKARLADQEDPRRVDSPMQVALADRPKTQVALADISKTQMAPDCQKEVDNMNIEDQAAMAEATAMAELITANQDWELAATMSPLTLGSPAESESESGVCESD